MGMPGSRDDADAIVLFGGDGTIHRHLASLVRLALPLLIVPAGSGNDFAGSIGLRRVRDALAAWKKFCDGAGNVRSIDLGVIAAVEKAVGAPAPDGVPAPHRPRYFCCVAGVGLDGEVSRRANRLPRWLRGHGGYLLSLAPTIFTFAPLPMNILHADRKREQERRLGHAQRWAHAAGGLCQHSVLWRRNEDRAASQNGRRAAGCLHRRSGCALAALAPVPYRVLPAAIWASGRSNTSRLRGSRIETEHPIDVYADGEYVCRTPVEIGIHPGALKIVTP